MNFLKKKDIILFFLLILLILIISIVLIRLIIKKKNKNNIENFKDPDLNIKLNIHSVLIIRENIPFLREWVIYHLNLGFDKIYLYDNTGSIGIDGSNVTKNKYNFNFNEIIKINEENIQQ